MIGTASVKTYFLSRKDVLCIAILAVLIMVVFPLVFDNFRLNLVGKYLTYAFVALGLVMCWGDAGILSLGQGIFFGIGGYAMAMFLKLEASSPENTKIQSTPGIPDFMDWNQLTSLPWFWQPFHSFGFTVVAVVAVPALLALVIGLAMFKRRVGGTYFAIITQAFAAILTILIIGQQGYTGGVNGMTDLRTLMGWDIRTYHAKYVLYFVTCVLLIACVVLSYWVRASKLGRILVAMRDREDRVRFSGYDVADFKGFMSPSFVGIIPSIEFVILCAVGGRTSVLGAVYGTLLVNFAKTTLSESFPQLWLLGLGALFIAVVVIFPDGLAGLYRTWIDPQVDRLMGRKKSEIAAAIPPAELTETSR